MTDEHGTTGRGRSHFTAGSPAWEDADFVLSWASRQPAQRQPALEMTAAPVTPAPDPALAFGTPRARWVLAATLLGSALTFIDATVVNVALPCIGDSLGAGLSSLAWPGPSTPTR